MDESIPTGGVGSQGSPSRYVLGELARLVEAVQEGNLSARAELGACPPADRPVLEGVNTLMAAVAAPVTELNAAIRAIGMGDDGQRVRSQYAGAWGEAASAIESVGERLSRMADVLGRFAEGDLSELDSLKKLGRFAEHDRLLPALLRLADATRRIGSDAAELALAAENGHLSVRMDLSHHGGEYGRIVSSFNAVVESILTPIGDVRSVLEQLARRDLRPRVTREYAGDHALLPDAVNTTASALNDALSQVAEAIGQLAAASEEIASSSQSVADGASQQASALEETTSSLESMASMTKQTADNAQQASSLAQAAKSAATQGGSSMGLMITAMGKIRASAEGTSQIIKDINEIAFQTNLLALNAAV